MNEGRALVGKLCRFWDYPGPWRMDTGVFATCIEVSDKQDSYMTGAGTWWNNAEAVEVTPVEVEPEMLSHEEIMSTEWVYDDNSVAIMCARPIGWTVFGNGKIDYDFPDDIIHEYKWFATAKRAPSVTGRAR